MWLVLHPVATWTEKRKNIECCGCVIVCLLSICWQGKRRFCSDYLTVSYPARSQCYTHKHNSENFAHVLFVRKCVHALRESQQLFEEQIRGQKKKVLMDTSQPLLHGLICNEVQRPEYLFRRNVCLFLSHKTAKMLCIQTAL